MPSTHSYPNTFESRPSFPTDIFPARDDKKLIFCDPQNGTEKEVDFFEACRILAELRPETREKIEKWLTKEELTQIGLAA